MNTLSVRILTFLAAIAGLTIVSLFALTNVQTVAANDNHDNNVTICHKNDGSGYTSNTVDESSIIKKDHGDCKKDGHGKHSEDIIPSFSNDGCNFSAQGDQSILANGCKVPTVDQCSNIEGTQESVPAGDYQTDDKKCYPKTPVCGDDSYDNYGGEDHRFDDKKEVKNDDLCENDPVDACPNIEGVQKSVPEGYHLNSDKQCVVNEQTPAPTQPPNQGGPGDGRSDGRSDGLSSCPSCTQAPKTNVLGAQTGQVLGATTDFAGTGVAEDLIMNVVGAIGGVSTAAGMFLKKRLNK